MVPDALLVRDSLASGLDIVFIGFNPSLASARLGCHYAGRSNRFWRILHEAGLTERLFTAKEGPLLLQLGYGLTNIVARPTKEAAEITTEEYRQGRDILLDKLRRFQPKIACYVGKGVYQKAARRDAGWGLQTASIVPNVLDYVAPSSSGLVRMRLEEQVAIYKGLVAVRDRLRGS